MATIKFETGDLFTLKGQGGREGDELYGIVLPNNKGALLIGGAGGRSGRWIETRQEIPPHALPVLNTKDGFAIPYEVILVLEAARKIFAIAC